MAKRVAIPSSEIKLALVNKLGATEVARLQSITLNSDLPVTDVYEIGNNTQVGTAVDSPNISLAFNAFDVGIKLFAALTNTDPTAYPAGGVSINNFADVDAILYVKDATLSQYVKYGHVKKLQVRDFSFSYNVTGETTENYTLNGSEKRWFKNDLIVDVFTSGTTTFTLSQSPILLKNGNYALTVTLGGVYLTETTSTPGTGQYRISGTTLTLGDTRTGSDKVVAVYQASYAQSWSYISDVTVPAVVKGRDSKVVISAINIPRIQSITINGTMNSQDVNELGNRSKVGVQKQTPAINGTITVLDTDTELIDLLLNGSINSGNTEFEVAGTCASGSGIDLKIKILDPCDSTVPYTVLKTVVVPNIMIVGDSYTVNVNQNVQQAFNFRSATANLIVYSGDY